jgi:hypothetical protein
MNHWLAGDAHGFNWSFFALFDCDMVPHPTFLQEMLPAMLRIDKPPDAAVYPPPRLPPQTAAVAASAAVATATRAASALAPLARGGLCLSQDDTVAFIATKQQFRNQPALDPLGHGQDVFYTTWEPALDTTDQVRLARRTLHLT